MAISGTLRPVGAQDRHLVRMKNLRPNFYLMVCLILFAIFNVLSVDAEISEQQARASPVSDSTTSDSLQMFEDLAELAAMDKVLAAQRQ